MLFFFSLLKFIPIEKTLHLTWREIFFDARQIALNFIAAVFTRR